jgi:hypothetical protein
MLQSMAVVLIFPFSLSTKSKVRAKCKYGAGCPAVQQAAEEHIDGMTHKKKRMLKIISGRN